jgi:hypothetical protein
MKKSIVFLLVFGAILSLTLYLIVFLSKYWVEITFLETKVMAIIVITFLALPTLCLLGKEIFIYSFRFNNRHPEKKHGEVFYDNIRSKDPFLFTKIGWKEKRMGIQAYDTYGKKLDDSYPVFIKKAEVEQKIEEYQEAGLPFKHLKRYTNG